MRKEPKWLKADRFERKARLMIQAPASEVFPLLCPVREYEWIPDWRCEMVYSRSGVAEREAMFLTRMMPFGKELWTCTLYEPPRRIEYLLTHGSKIAMKLELELTEEDGKAALDWTMRFTAVGGFWGRMLRARYEGEGFDAMMRQREGELAEYFAADP
jgi:hypothetical protein